MSTKSPTALPILPQQSLRSAAQNLVWNGYTGSCYETTKVLCFKYTQGWPCLFDFLSTASRLVATTTDVSATNNNLATVAAPVRFSLESKQLRNAVLSPAAAAAERTPEMTTPRINNFWTGWIFFNFDSIFEAADTMLGENLTVFQAYLSIYTRETLQCIFWESVKKSAYHGPKLIFPSTVDADFHSHCECVIHCVAGIRKRRNKEQ